jgi:hypothetical protein
MLVATMRARREGQLPLLFAYAERRLVGNDTRSSPIRSVSVSRL